MASVKKDVESGIEYFVVQACVWLSIIFIYDFYGNIVAL
jgi:hypothetical protein